MIVWSVTNQKGGVGKTTTAVSLAGCHALNGQRVLLIDLDPHGSLSTYFGYSPETQQQGVYELFNTQGVNRKSLIQLVHGTGVDNLFLIPASTAIATLDSQLLQKQGKGLVIASWLKLLNGMFDHVFLDCPPTLGVLMINALAACDHLLIPTQTEYLAVNGLERMTNTINMVDQSRSHQTEYTIIPTMYDKRTRASANSLSLMLQNWGDNVWNDVVPQDTLFREASFSHLPVTHYASQSRGSLAYHQLCLDLSIHSNHLTQAVAS
ncbi:ParA-like protein [hydrothermal vent metagenome]|uniref:ParA-like protein n=1 Tax=hydrothermal vent metagenome TaxID=652676 RepID=A0A3B0Y9P8_9ZZZZ